MLKTGFMLIMNAVAGGKAKVVLQAKKAKLPVVHYQIKTDTAKVNIRAFNPDTLNKYRHLKDFDYVIKKAGLNAWDRFWIWVWHAWTDFWEWVGRLIERLFGTFVSKTSAGSLITYILITAFAIFIVWVILKLFGINLFGIFKKKPAGVDVPYSESLENIHEINFDEDIDNAMAAKNYRLAIRLLYLRSLKQLSDAGLINWKIEKTNTAYINELTDADQRSKFASVTRQFEYVWYGDFPVDGELFQDINAIFQEFKLSLS